MHFHILATAILAVILTSAPALSGTLSDATFHSNALNSDLPVNIYRPDGEPPEKWLGGSLSAARA